MTMNLNEAKIYIQEELSDVDSEQLEYLCEELIREVEDPDSLEVTTFHHDKGIDIRGRTGDTLYRGEFGVQVKQQNSSVGAPTVQRFAGALDVDGANFGTFITTSDFTKPARTDVKETDELSIQLISGTRLAEIMVENEMGVVLQSEEEQKYAKEYDLWGEFEIDEDLIKSKMVPQADSLEVLRHTILGVHNGSQFKPELAVWLTEQTEEEWTRRQADYYAIAAHALGLLAVDSGEYEIRGTPREVRKWKLTPAGREYVSHYEDDPARAEEYLHEQIQDLEIMRLVTEKIKDEIAIFQSEIADVIRMKTTVSGSTADRRATTIGKWLNQIDIPVRRMEKGGGIKYAYQAGITDDFS